MDVLLSHSDRGIAPRMREPRQQQGFSYAYITGEKELHSKRSMPRNARIVFTVGHSTRRMDEFADLLKKFTVEQILVVGTTPRSKRKPQFNLEPFSQRLEADGIN